jgi:hypothetical protein
MVLASLYLPSCLLGCRSLPPFEPACWQADCGNYFEYYLTIDTRVPPCYHTAVKAGSQTAICPVAAEPRVRPASGWPKNPYIRVYPCFPLSGGPSVACPDCPPRGVNSVLSDHLPAATNRTLVCAHLINLTNLTSTFPMTYKINPQSKSYLSLLFSISSALFCTLCKSIFPRNPFIFFQLRTLLDKHPGWGWAISRVTPSAS